MAFYTTLPATQASANGIDPQLEDQIIDFIAIPSKTIGFYLPDPQAGCNVVINTTFRADDVPMTTGINPQPTTSGDARYDWQVRYWANGIPQTPTASAGGVGITGATSGPTLPVQSFSRAKFGTWKVKPIYATYSPYPVITPGVSALGSNELWTSGAPAYTFVINSPGPQIADFSVTSYPNSAAFDSATTNNFASYPWPSAQRGLPVTTTDGHIRQTFMAFQQAVAVIKDSTGANVSNTSPVYTNKLSTDHIIFDSSASYGGDVSYQWSILKSTDGGATWSTAVSGTDYVLNSGSLNTKGSIDLTFAAPATSQPALNYQIIFQVTGYSTSNNPFVNVGESITSKGNSGPNIDIWTATVQVTGAGTLSTTTTTVNLPTLIPSLNVISTNPVTETSPQLIVSGDTTIQVTTLLNNTNALKQTLLNVYSISGSSATLLPGYPITNTLIPSDTSLLPVSDPSNAVWVKELNVDCSVTVQLRQHVGTSITIIQQKSGLGPFTFAIGAGTYDIAYIVGAPKPYVVVASSLELASTITTSISL